MPLRLSGRKVNRAVHEDDMTCASKTRPVYVLRKLTTTHLAGGVMVIGEEITLYVDQVLLQDALGLRSYRQAAA
jgi:hypothetical protein